MKGGCARELHQHRMLGVRDKVPGPILLDRVNLLISSSLNPWVAKPAVRNASATTTAVASANARARTQGTAKRLAFTAGHVARSGAVRERRWTPRE